MEIFKIEIQEFLSKIIEIEGENINEAVSKVKEMYNNQEIVLDYNNYVSTEINEFPKIEQPIRDSLCNGENFYLVDNGFVYFWGLNITSKKIEINDKLSNFIKENKLPFSEVCKFKEDIDFKLFELFY